MKEAWKPGTFAASSTGHTRYLKPGLWSVVSGGGDHILIHPPLTGS